MIITSDFINIEKEEYAKYIMREASAPIDSGDTIKFVDILYQYPVLGKEKTLNLFNDFVDGIVKKYGAIGAMTIVTVCFFTGVLNVNGVISNIEVENMNKIFNDRIKKAIEEI